MVNIWLLEVILVIIQHYSTNEDVGCGFRMGWKEKTRMLILLLVTSSSPLLFHHCDSCVSGPCPSAIVRACLLLNLGLFFPTYSSPLTTPPPFLTMLGLHHE